MRTSFSFAAGALLAMTAVVLPSCNKSSDDPFAEVDLLPVRMTEDGKWSMINDKGEIVYDSEFKEEPTLSVNGYFSVKEGETYTLYKSTEKSPTAVDGCEKLKGVGAMSDDGLVPIVKTHERITVVDGSGKKKFELAPAAGKEIVSCAPTFTDGMLRVQNEDGKYGFYDGSGKLLINATYDQAGFFADGVVVVGKEYKSEKDSTETKMRYEVIDKKGNTVFKLKDGQTPMSQMMDYGYLPVTQDDGEKIFLYDRKGETIKIPSKLKSITGYTDKYIVYLSDDNQYGIADMEGEVLIRPKYDDIEFLDKEGTFLAKKGEKEYVVIDNKGEVLQTCDDYEDLRYLGHFGFLGKDGKTWDLLDEEFKEKGKDNFYDYSATIFSTDSYGEIESDYFNITGVAESLVGLITGNGIKDYALGASPASLLKGESPNRYEYTNSYSPDEPLKKGYRYTINAQLQFTDRLANSTWNSNNYEWIYSWNPEAKLSMIALSVNAYSELGQEAYDAVCKELTGKGYKLVKKGFIYEGFAALYKKGSTLAYTVFQKKGKEGGIVITEASDPSIETNLKNLISEKEGEDPVVEDSVAVAEECVEVIDSTAVEEAW